MNSFSPISADLIQIDLNAAEIKRLQAETPDPDIENQINNFKNDSKDRQTKVDSLKDINCEKKTKNPCPFDRPPFRPTGPCGAGIACAPAPDYVLNINPMIETDYIFYISGTREEVIRKKVTGKSLKTNLPNISAEKIFGLGIGKSYDVVITTKDKSGVEVRNEYKNIKFVSPQTYWLKLSVKTPKHWTELNKPRIGPWQN